ncbi:MAG: hypothetical protein JNK05_03485 [Myxococcales bacterium]|nr:hypothetical protein [Myxococcales bacterium]
MRTWIQPTRRSPGLARRRARVSVALLGASLAACGPAVNAAADGAPSSDSSMGPFPLGDDPCMGVSEQGACAADGRLEYCNVPTDVDEDESVPVEVVRAACGAGERCAVNAGFAECVPSGECRDRDSRCNGAALQRCNAGRWQDEPCATECVDTGIGAANCARAPSPDNRTLRVTFEAREPNAERTDWSAETVTRNAEGFQVVVYRGMEVVDEGRTGAGEQAGRVSISVPAGDDVRVVVSAVQDDQAQGVALALADPNMGAMRLTPGFVPSNPRLWSWEFTGASLMNDTLHITEENGSGAANLFNVLHRAYREVRRRFPSQRPLSLVAWAGDGTTYSCGACMNSRPIDVFEQNFRSQIWMPMGGANHQEWSDAVTGHEAGHWVMASFGRSPGEGGAHTIGVPTMPGQAWSEGFATWFSYEVLRWPAYVDKQNGSMFWADITTRTYHRMRAWRRPTADAPDGMQQRHDENDVSAMLLALAGSDAAPIFTALNSERMRVAPFARGYARHTWSTNYTNIRRTQTSAPFLADMLDALNCASFSRDSINAAAVPDTHYPYPTTTPLCATGGN